MELEFNVNKSNKGLSRWHIFLFTFLIVFLFTAIQNLGTSGFNLLSPLPFQDSVFQKITPKLQEKPNDYELKRPAALIESSYASIGDFSAAKSYLAIDYDTGEIILEKNLSEKLPIASLTKIMTAVVALDLINPNEEITISGQSTHASPTKIGVVKSQKMTAEELLNAILLTSANDAAYALKDGINAKYNEDIFVRAMNEKAKNIGLKNTSFSNSAGFDGKKNFSSVEDLAVLTHYALSNYPLISDIVKKDYEFLPATTKHKQFDLYNWNGLLGVYPGVRGVKIGNTDAAGHTTMVVSERNDRKILAVLLGAPGVLERDLWTSQILDEAFGKHLGISPVAISEYDLQQKYSTWRYWN